MGAALEHIDQEDYSEAVGEDSEKISGYGFTTVIMNKYTGKIIKTIKYRQILITLEERKDMDENLSYEKDHITH